MKCVILAGGLGSRLSEETTRIPKPMVQIGERPILWHIMKIYGHWGITDFVVCLGYKGYVIKEYFANYRLHTSDVTFDLSTGDMQIVANTTEPWRVTLVDTGQESMTGGRLRRVMPHLRGHPRTGARPQWHRSAHLTRPWRRHCSSGSGPRRSG